MQLNYIDIIRWFWDEVPQMEGYKSEYTTLFFALLDSINRNKWEQTPIEYDRIIFKTNIGKRMYLSGRRWLDDNKIIAMVEGRGDYAKARFSIGSAVLDAVQKRTAQRTADRTAPTPQAAPHTAPIIIDKPLKPLKPLNNEDGRKEDDQPTFEKEGFLEKVLPENKQTEIVAKEGEIQSPQVPAAPPYDWNTLPDVLARDRGFLEWGQRELKIDLDQLKDFVLDYIVFQHGRGRPLNQNYEDLKQHIINYSRGKLEKQTQEPKKQTRHGNSTNIEKPNYEDVLQIVNERYFGQTG